MKIVCMMLISMAGTYYMYGMEATGEKSLVQNSAIVSAKQKRSEQITLATLLQNSCAEFNFTKAQELLGQGANPNTKLQSVVCDAFGRVLCEAKGTVLFNVLVIARDEDIPEEKIYRGVKLLLDHGADPTMAGYLNIAEHLKNGKFFPMHVVSHGYNAVGKLLKKQYRKNIKKHRVWMWRDDLDTLVAFSQEAISGRKYYNEPYDRLKAELEEAKKIYEKTVFDTLANKTEHRSGLPNDVIRTIYEYVTSNEKRVLVKKITILDLIRLITEHCGVFLEDGDSPHLILGDKKMKIYKGIYDCYCGYFSR